MKASYIFLALLTNAVSHACMTGGYRRHRSYFDDYDYDFGYWPTGGGGGLGAGVHWGGLGLLLGTLLHHAPPGEVHHHHHYHYHPSPPGRGYQDRDKREDHPRSAAPGSSTGNNNNFDDKRRGGLYNFFKHMFYRR